MTDAALVLFDDDVARDWRPFTLTRPVGELFFGTETLRARAEREFGLTCAGHLCGEALASFDEHDSPGAVAFSSIPRDRAVLFLSSRAVPAPPGPPPFGSTPELIAVDGEVCGCWVPAGHEPPAAAFFAAPARNAPEDYGVREFSGRMLRHIWDLVVGNADRTARDIEGRFPEPPHAELPDGVHRVGAAPLVVGEDVAIDPGVVLDLTNGPIWLDEGVRVRAFTRVAGPAYIGRGSTLLGGPFEAVSIGPVCKVHGEVEESVILGYANKAHDGYLGHAYLGRWVNLGALTTNSDLKNNYGPVRIWTPDGVVDTGETKLGCLLGDHVKTAIGTMLTTGTVVEAGANVFGGAPPRYVPPFAWGTDDPAAAYDLEKFLEVAGTIMARRDVGLTDDQRALLRVAWRRGRAEHAGTRG